MRKINYFLTALILCCIIALVIKPETCINASLQGIIVWGTIVLPSLLPFFFLTKILIELDTMPRLTKFLGKPTNKLFHCPSLSSYVFCMSVISGYPLGAKLVSEYYEHGLINQGEAYRMTSFCSTSGPMFIIGSVGIGMFADSSIGFIVIACHIIGAIINGLIFRNFHYSKVSKLSTQAPPSRQLLNDSMYSSIQSIIMVGGYICISFVIIAFINEYHLLDLIPKLLSLLHMDSNIVKYTLNGILEVTQGCKSLSSLSLTHSVLLPLLTFIISFGGFSVHLQSLAFLKKCNISYPIFLLQKLCHGLISAVLCVIFCLIIY